MADAPPRHVEPHAGDTAPGLPAPKYAGLFVEPDIPSLDDEPE
ncbi:hypothetical protein [Streptomyces sp. PA03-2a]|nr:hypothetical protein [Streptomyces sp. PA03-2a]MDX2731190.1 hypothetical protein [Streptomyces sp. PA03-2a]